MNQSSLKLQGKNHHNQIINIIASDLIKKHKKRKPKPQPPEIPQDLPPPTLEEEAAAIKPIMYPPSNVITINPYNAPVPTMFDVFKQQQLNSLHNLREDMMNQFQDLRLNSQAHINQLVNTGRTQEAERFVADLDDVERSISAYSPSQSSYMPSEIAQTDGSTYEPTSDWTVEYAPSMFSEASYGSPSQAASSPEITQHENPVFDEVSTPVIEEEQSPVQEPTLPPSELLRTMPKYYEEEEQEDPEVDESNIPSTSQRPATPEIEEPDIASVKGMIDENIERHGQKRVQMAGWQKGYEYIKTDAANFKDMNKRDKAFFRQSIKDFAMNVVEDMISRPSDRIEAMAKIERVFSRGKHLRTQMQYVEQLLGI